MDVGEDGDAAADGGAGAAVAGPSMCRSGGEGKGGGEGMDVGEVGDAAADEGVGGRVKKKGKRSKNSNTRQAGRSGRERSESGNMFD